MSEPTRRFLKLPDGTMHESAHGDWVRYGDLALATQRAEAAEEEAKVLREVSIKFNRIGWTMLEALGDVGAEDEVIQCNAAEVADRFIAQRNDAVSQLADYTQEVLHLRAERDALTGVLEQVRPSVTSAALLRLIDASLSALITGETHE